MSLNIWNDSWPLDVDVCPCDVHFTEYLASREVRNAAIFHFGTGEHHHLGRDNVESGLDNEILAITASRKEHEAYMDLIIENPAIANRYKTIFADIYTLSPALLPVFELVTLFHLCEFYDPEASAYARLNDESLLTMFLGQLGPDGRVAFYTGSTMYRKTTAIIERFVDAGRMEHVDTFKTLAFYTSVGGKGNV